MHVDTYGRHLLRVTFRTSDIGYLIWPTLQVTENTIIDLPTGVVTFHMDNNEPRVPAIAVASASHIYIYKVQSLETT